MNCPAPFLPSQALPTAVVLPPRVIRPLRPPRVKVLVVLNGDNYVECYADDHVDIHVATKITTIRECESLADELLDCTLPRVYRDLYWPRKLRAVGQCREVTAEQAHDTIGTLQMLAALRKLREDRP